MRIKYMTIYGFGKWVNSSFDFSKNSLTCLIGENESGKSTLQMFILFMLFGFPPKTRSLYQPKTYGTLGGRMTIDDPKFGKVTIERFAERNQGRATCYLSNGNVCDDNWLTERLKGLTMKTYQSIYSFSALDLVGIEDMKEKDLGEVILSIGLTGSQNIYRVEKYLVKQLNQLFKPYGKVPAINQQLQRVDELFKTLHTQREKETNYRDKQLTLSSIKEDIAQLKNKREHLLHERTIVQKKKQALSALKAYDHYQQTLEQFPKHLPFPERGIDRSKMIKEKLLPLQSEQKILQESRKKNEQSYENIVQQLFNEDIIKEAKKIIEQQITYEKKQQTLSSLKKTNEHIRINIDDQLNDLNIDLHINHLQHLHFPFHIEKLWEALKNEQQQIILQEEQLQQEYHSLKQQKEKLQEQLQQTEKNLLANEHINELRETINIFYTQQNLEQFRENQSRQMNVAHMKRKTSYMLFISVCIGALLGITGFIFDMPQLYYGMLSVIMIGMSQWLIGKQLMSQTQKTFTTEAYLLDMNITKAMKDEAERKLQNNQAYEQAYNVLNEQLKSLDIQLIKWQEKEVAVLQRKERLNKRIHAECERYPFLSDINLLYWTDLLHTLKKLIERYEKLCDNERQMTELQADKAKYEQSVKRFCQQIDFFDEEQSIDDMLQAIQTFIDEQHHLRSLSHHSEKAIRETKEKEAELMSNINIYEQEMKSLFKVAEVETEEAFYQRASVVEQKEHTLAMLEKLKKQIATIFSHEEWTNINIDTLDQPTLEMEEQQINDALHLLDNELEDKRQQLADINADMLQMETSEDYSKTVHQYHIEKTHLQSLAQKWAVYKTALDVLKQTKQAYREKYLDQIITKTANYFKHMTDGRYIDVFAPSKHQKFQVETSHFIRYNVHELSRGTIDQLYIALRLAISDIMGMKHKVPFIIDDAFIHSDHIRKGRIVDILRHISHRQQIILLTCDENILEYVNNMQVIHLKNF